MATSDSKSGKIVNDPIHGVIELPELCVQIIDTPEFQRLRFIKQLGGSYFVYPGAAHNRFEHSIGVCYLAGQLLEAIKRRQRNLLTNHDIELVQVAGLCHDMGHGPFSHMFDSAVLPNLKHEELSVKMFDHMLQQHKICFKNGKPFEPEQIKFVHELIEGPPKDVKYEDWLKTTTHGTTKKMFLYEVVNNKRNEIDVDKWDYFARDCHMLGIGNNFDHKRCIAIARVIKVKDQWQICYRDKEYNGLLEMFHTRYQLHRRAYQHKTCNGIEKMIANALVDAADYITFQGASGKRKLSEVADHMDAYTLMTDDVFYRILNSDQKELSSPKKLLMRVLKRDLYQCVREKLLEGPESETQVKKLKESLEKKRLNETDDFWVDTVNLNYGNKTENPMDKVYFYGKKNLNKAEQLSQKDVSHLLPSKWEEKLVRVYCKRKDKKKQVEDVFDKVSRTWD